MSAVPESPSELLRQAEEALRLADFDASLRMAGLLEQRLDQGLDEATDAQQAGLRLRLQVHRVRHHAKAEQFDTAIALAETLLPQLTESGQELARSELLFLLSFSYSQTSQQEPALRAGVAALHLALRLDHVLQIGQSLERIAMCCMAAEDAVHAERFMLEALGFFEQQADAEQMLRATSNTLFMFCRLADRLTTGGWDREARQLLQRLHRVVARSIAPSRQAESEYTRCIWRANHARWLLRMGRSEAGAAEMQACHGLCLQRGWHAIRHPVCIELARHQAALGHTQQALDLLNGALQPRLPAMRDDSMLSLSQLMAQLLEASGRAAEAAPWSLRAQELAAHIGAGSRIEAPILEQLCDEVESALLAADQRRLDQEIERLRQQFGQ